jgi:hypothetical protein
MITPEIVRAVREALALLPPAMDTIEAHVEMYAIGLQESRFEHRRQLVGNPPRPTGPAKGFWQFERGGGCRGVVEHDASRYWMSSVCKARGVAFSATAIWNALEKDDVLAAAAARLLLFTDPKKLPEVGKADEAWNCYKRTWWQSVNASSSRYAQDPRCRSKLGVRPGTGGTGAPFGRRGLQPLQDALGAGTRAYSVCH